MDAPITFNDSNTYRILVQLLMAFSQGAGTMRVTGGVVDAVTEDYRTVIDQSDKRWEDIEIATLEFARNMGRLAAHLALAHHQSELDIEHYRGARHGLKSRRECSFCQERALA